MVVGIYHHPSPDYLAPYVQSYEVSPTFTHEVEAFASSYVAKSALWLARLP
jgi:hypothetical protein